MPLATVIATPLAWYGMNQWLNGLIVVIYEVRFIIVDKDQASSCYRLIVAGVGLQTEMAPAFGYGDRWL